jgi:hypothetical protein
MRITEEEKIKLIEMLKASCENCKRYRSCYPECRLWHIMLDIRKW